MDEHTRDSSVDPPPLGRSPTGWLPEEDRWEHDTLRRAVVHGVRLFNAGDFHESHDCFEDEWFNYGHGTLERDFLQGMVQVAAGVHKYEEYDSQEGLRRLFRTGRGYLEDAPADFYGVDVDELRQAVESTLAEPVQYEGFQIILDGRNPTAREEDVAYAEALP
ncbi:MAG: DUF309 domain-containing protein [Halodesulfurarchaeum sp.]